MHTFSGLTGCNLCHPPLLRLIILSNHKLVIAKAKADCDSPPSECRPRTERRPPAARRLRAGRAPAVRVPSAGRRRIGYFPKAELDIFRYLMSG